MSQLRLDISTPVGGRGEASGGADASSKGNESAMRYAAAYWVCLPNWSTGRFEVAFGWAISRDVGGSWGISFDSAGHDLPVGPWPEVEEPRGILFPAATASERVVDEGVERVISDHLLLLAHRVLFGQARNALPHVNFPGPPVDLLLVFGPTLPKFVGRLCYTHMSRAKTIAILAPNLRGSVADVSGADWEEHPAPGYWEDCAVRRWRVRGTVNGVNPERDSVLTFEIIAPVGDAIGGRPSSESPIGAKLWEYKAALIKHVVRHGMRAPLPLPNDQTTFVPVGIALAARNAFLYWPSAHARARVREVKRAHPECQQDVFPEIEIKIRTLGSKIPSGVEDMVRAGAYTRAAAIRANAALPPRGNGSRRLAARKASASALIANVAVADALKAVLRDYGEFSALEDLEN